MNPPLSPSDELAQLQRLLPHDYFQGIQARNLCFADNVIVFRRDNRDVLNQRNFESRPHHRHVLVINFRTGGSVSVDGSVYHLQPGDAFLIAPFQFHFYMDIPDRPLNWLFITFETPLPAPFAAMANNPIAITDELARQAVAIARAYDRRNEHGQLEDNELILAVSSFLNALRRLAQEQSPAQLQSLTPGKTGYGLVQKVNRLLHDRLAEGIGIQELAARLNLSESHLRKRFKTQTGLSLGSYLIHYKLNRAVKLLVHSESSLSQIATECGYESLAAFSRSFKSKLGAAPSHYRRNGQATAM